MGFTALTKIPPSGKLCDNGFVILAGMLHAGFCFHVKVSDLLDESVDFRLGMENVTGRHYDHSDGAADCDSAFTF